MDAPHANETELPSPPLDAVAQRSDSPSSKLDPPFCPPDGRYVTPRARDSDSATSFAASMRLTSMRPVPHSSRAREMISAAAASPSARITEAFFSCSAFATMYVWRSASCWATCFCSMAPENSLPKTRCVIETSSRIMSKLSARFVSVLRIWVLCVYC